MNYPSNTIKYLGLSYFILGIVLSIYIVYAFLLNGGGLGSYFGVIFIVPSLLLTILGWFTSKGQNWAINFLRIVLILLSVLGFFTVFIGMSNPLSIPIALIAGISIYISYK